PALPIETIPGAPSFLRGVVFVRGHWIPVLDAGERLGVRRRPPAESPIVCLTVQGKLIGLEVDEALDLMDLGRGARAGAEDLGVSEGFFAGLLEQEGESIRLLNPARLLATEEAARLPRSAPGDEGVGLP
ncbi:MAG: chemotaxis protein CheW, partial [Planctomycetes bacterium]|nr:chemotaxis protein CheW [Planctomycetota bacterium]